MFHLCTPYKRQKTRGFVDNKSSIAACFIDKGATFFTVKQWEVFLGSSTKTRGKKRRSGKDRKEKDKQMTDFIMMRTLELRQLWKMFLFYTP